MFQTLLTYLDCFPQESGTDGPSHSRTRRNLRAQGQSGHGRDRLGDIHADMSVKRMIALYDYDPQELSPNVDAEVEGQPIIASRTTHVTNAVVSFEFRPERSSILLSTVDLLALLLL